MKEKLLLLCTIFSIPMTAYSVAPQAITKEQIEQAFEKKGQDDSDLHTKISEKYNQQFDKIKKDQALEMEKTSDEEVYLPLSIPMIKTMVTAADKHDKKMLRDSVADYFAVMFGNDWPKLLEKAESGMDFGKQRKLLFYRDDKSGIHWVNTLGTIWLLRKHYSNKSENVSTWKDQADQSDEFLKELGFDDPSYSYTQSKQSTTKEQIVQASKDALEKYRKFLQGLHDKYDPQLAKIFGQINDELKKQITETNIKQYGLKKNIAEMISVPFSIPLIKEIFIAADEHNKEKLKALLSDYFAIMVGNNWREFLRERVLDDNSKIVEIVTKDPHDLIGLLAPIYFKVPRKKSFNEIDELNNKFIKELFEIKK